MFDITSDMNRSSFTLISISKSVYYFEHCKITTFIMDEENEKSIFSDFEKHELNQDYLYEPLAELDF